MTEKERKYEQMARELTALVEGEGDIAAVLANSSALLHNIFNFFLGRLLHRKRPQPCAGSLSGRHRLLPHQLW